MRKYGFFRAPSLYFNGVGLAVRNGIFGLVVASACFVCFLNCSPMNSQEAVLQNVQGTEPTPVELNLTNMVIDNLDTYYQIPPNAKGVIYFYHGTGGSAGSSANQVETEIFEKAALARGYGLVFLESTNRTSKQWTATTDPTVSPDIQHIERVRSYLRSVGLSAQIPEYGLGMSNGGGFVPYAGYYFKYRSVAIYCAAGYLTVFQKADYTIPTFFMVAEHDKPSDFKRFAAAAAKAMGGFAKGGK